MSESKEAMMAVSNKTTIDVASLPGVVILAGASAVTRMPTEVFSKGACSFLAELSKALLNDAKSKLWPDVVSFAYWCRRSNIDAERRARESRLCNRLGRGIAFHITPSNVPVNFAFSWAFSLLAGNSSVVRVPSRPFAQIDAILNVVQPLLQEYPEVLCRSTFVRYPASSGATELISTFSDVRVIWGGDSTVAAVRSCPCMPRCVDVCFSDRYSIAVLGARGIAQMNGEELSKVAHAFYNDTYLMDQNACSSPQTVVWQGDQESIQEARAVFWAAVRSEVHKRYELQPAIVMDKYVQACSDLIKNRVSGVERHDGYLTTAELSKAHALSELNRGTGGYFYEKSVGDFSEVLDAVDERYQTITFAGIDGEDLRRQVLRCRARGIDRVVPLGQAMNLGLLWDGYDLVETLSRKIARV